MAMKVTLGAHYVVEDGSPYSGPPNVQVVEILESRRLGHDPTIFVKVHAYDVDGERLRGHPIENDRLDIGQLVRPWGTTQEEQELIRAAESKQRDEHALYARWRQEWPELAEALAKGLSRLGVSYDPLSSRGDSLVVIGRRPYVADDVTDHLDGVRTLVNLLEREQKR